MSTRTGIEWTDATWNVLVGCTKVSRGCKHCYAKTLHDRRQVAYLSGKPMPPQYAHPFERVQFLPERLDQPLRWRAPRRIFVNALSDLFHDQVTDEQLDRIFAVMALAPRHTFQVLTKRPERMRDYLSARYLPGRIVDTFIRFGGWAFTTEWPLENVWLGVSVENQDCANERIPLLARTPAAVRFLSCEPLLGPIDFEEAGSLGPEVGDPWAFSALTGTDGCDEPIPGMDWVIVGGESGPGARPMDLRWAASIVAQCRAAGVPVFVKQLGAVPMEPESDWRGRALTRVLSAKNRNRVPDGFVPLACGGDAKGGRIECWPAELQVREFPRALNPARAS